MASIGQLWRFPVKSMGGHRVESARVTRRGLHGDRLWAVRDLDNDITATARRIPALLTCTARYAGEPGPAAGPGNVPPVIITLPDGTELRSDDPTTADRLSELVGRRVALTPLAADNRAQRLRLRQMLTAMSPEQLRADLGLTESDPMPDAGTFTIRELMNLTRYSTPPGTFVDIAAIHVLTTSSLAHLERLHGTGLDVRRFRPNVLLEADETGLPERGWIGSHLVTGRVRLRVDTPTVRCVVPGRAQPGIELDPALGRTLSAHTDRYLGVYAGVATPGLLTVGDDVQVESAAAPTATRSASHRALAAAKRATFRVGQATILR